MLRSTPSHILFNLLLLVSLHSIKIEAQTVQLANAKAGVCNVAVGTTSIAVVWMDDQLFMKAEILDHSGNVVRPPFTIVIDEGHAGFDVVAAGDTFAVVWNQHYAARMAIFDHNGLRSAPLTVALTLYTGATAVTSDGLQFLLFWGDSLHSQAAWITTDGVVDTRFDLPAGVFDATAFNHSAVALIKDAAGLGAVKIDGHEVGEPSLIVAAPPGSADARFFPTIAKTSTGYFVAWQDSFIPSGTIVEGTRLTFDLQPLDVDPTAATTHYSGGRIIDYSTAPAQAMSISAAGARLLLGWMRTEPGNDRLRGRYIDQNGEPSGAVSFPVIDSMGERVESGRIAALPDGTPVAVYSLAPSGKLFVRYGAGGLRVRAIRR